MNACWNERTRHLRPYTPGEQPGDRICIKINTNENPYPPSPRAVAAMAEAVGEELRLYPGPSARRCGRPSRAPRTCRASGTSI
jgi:histidinol-phosphate aminotransferase